MNIFIFCNLVLRRWHWSLVKEIRSCRIAIAGLCLWTVVDGKILVMQLNVPSSAAPPFTGILMKGWAQLHPVWRVNTIFLFILNKHVPSWATINCKSKLLKRWSLKKISATFKLLEIELLYYHSSDQWIWELSVFVGVSVQKVSYFATRKQIKP